MIKPQPQRSTGVPVPAPVGGVNAQSPLAGMAANDAVYLYNLIPSPYGCKVRPGWRAWAQTLAGNPEIRTVIPYIGVAADGSDDRLFFATSAGIYDATTQGAAPTLAISFPAPVGPRTGFGTSVVHADLNGVARLLYADEQNGYYVYVPASGWSKVTMGGGAGQVSGVDPAKFCHVAVFKERLWFIEADSGNSWYLPAGAYAGAATKFSFGNKFQAGGALAHLVHWTASDGGQGLDDLLVAISRQGDILVYKGSDPDVAGGADFGLVSQWSVGPVPAGRRFTAQHGGELFVLCEAGVVQMSRLVQGQSVADGALYASDKISPLIAADMTYAAGYDGWELAAIPSQRTLVISTPTEAPGARHQYVCYLPTQTWGVYRDVPTHTLGVWRGSLYFGTADGRICQHYGTVDGVAVDGSNAQPITFSGLSSFQAYGDGARFKRVQLMRPVFQCDSAEPVYRLEARYDFAKTEPSLSIPGTITGGALWDAASWDGAVWSGGELVSQRLQGAQGIGRNIAVAFVGAATTAVTLVGFDLIIDSGGPL